jgi:gliding motility-associated lipoprotein GldH
MVSCNHDVVYDQYQPAGSDGWAWQDTKEFEADITDTVSLHNLYIQVRHTLDYPMSNLYMFVRIEGPSGQTMTDTVNVFLAYPDGKWIGSGIGKLKELSLLYRKHTVFAQPGRYRFMLEQGMRSPEIPVTDVGIRIEKQQP